MGFKPQDMVGHLRNDFSGEAANDEEPPLFRQLLTHMDSQQEDIGRTFREEMAGVFREMNMDTALAQQSGFLDGKPLGTDKVVIPHVDLAVWMYVDNETWEAVIDSYIEDMALNDPEKFAKVYETVGQPSVDHYKSTGKHLDVKAVHLAFEDAYKDEMQALRMVTEILEHHLPGVSVSSCIAHVNDSHITPVVRVTAPEGQDLRDMVRAFVDQKPALTGLRPRP